MAFGLQKAACVAAGAFNVDIVQPQWLTAKGLLPVGVEITLESKLDESGFRFHSPELKVCWLVTPTHIVIETDDQGVDCGALMARLLTFLPETPLVGVGNNALFETQSEAGTVGSLPDYPVIETMSGDILRQQAFLVSIAREPCLFNLQLSILPERVELFMNVHCPVGGWQKSALAQEHAKRFMEHRRAAAVLARHHLKVTVDV